MSIEKKHVTVNGRTMAYVEEGEGRPIVFLHGNPTSSYLWRNVMPHVSGLGRCLAPDLIGMGDSDKLPDPGPDSYRFVEHREYLNGWFDQVVTDGPAILVVHDWGSALGFDWAHRNPERVRGIAYMEGIVKPMEWDEFSQAARPVFEGFRSPMGEEMVLEKNVFVEKVLPGSIMRDLTDEEMAEYRRPFAQTGEDRRPTLTWPRQIPLGGEPEDVVDIVTGYGNWMAAQRHAQAVHQHRARRNPDRQPARVLPLLAEPDRGYRQGHFTSSRKIARTRSARRYGRGLKG